jgi:hypothetical protein
VVEQREVWLACVREARTALMCGIPQPEWVQLESLVDGSARVANFVHREGSALAISMRRLVGGCIAMPSDEKGIRQKGPSIMIAASQAYEAGMRLQSIAWEHAQELRDLITSQTRELAKVRALAQQWRAAVVEGGPKRAAVLAEAVAARCEVRVAVVRALKSRRLRAAEAYEVMAACEARILEHIAWARGPLTSVCHSVRLCVSGDGWPC